MQHPVLNKIHSSWYPILSLINQPPLSTLKNEILPKTNYSPKKEDIFNVFSMPVDEVKVVIIDQEPHLTKNEAIGYGFATFKERDTPKSLKILAKELQINYPLWRGSQQEGWKELQSWRDSGVFLLNLALTVEIGNAESHLHYWERFTKNVIHFISKENPCIWIMMGKKAQMFIPQIANSFMVKGYHRRNLHKMPFDPRENHIFSIPHPTAEIYSEGNAGFYGSDAFYLTNMILHQKGKDEILW
ncbi:uracil-DNA glycosylase [bacterium]|nr:uracil-DNA glycosylase [bacterium]